MTIRDGRSPRDHARPSAPGSRLDPEMPTWRASDGRGRPPGDRRRAGRDRRGGIPGFLKFLLFSGILAALVLVALLTALRPLLRAVVVGWAWDTPSSFHFPLVADLVREDLDGKLDQPGGTDATEQVFDVQIGDTPQTLADRLDEGGFIADKRAFIFTAIQDGLADKLKAGSYVIRQDMTPEQLVTALVDARVVIESVPVTFREGLRLEQMTAKLETIVSGVDPKAFYDLVAHPTAKLHADYPWLADLPAGATLEGFLYPATYTLVTAANGGPVSVTTADDLVRMMLDKFASSVGEARMNVPKERGLTFYQVVTLASIVEREAVLDEERPLIAGVYQNRLSGYKGVAKILNADPTVIWAVDTVALSKLDLEAWREYFFWKVPDGKLKEISLPESLQGYQTYQVAGLIPGPICSPTVASIDAALEPNTASGYLYFVAIPEGKGAHAFAKSLDEHNANLKKYGYL